MALAFVARRQGTRSMPQSAWAHVLSLELGWLPPGDAKAFVAACVDAGLLAGEPATLQVPSDIDVPRGFRLDPGIRPEPVQEQDPFVALVQAVAQGTGADMSDVFAAVATTQDEHGLLDAPAALLLWASTRMDVKPLAAKARQGLAR